MNSWQTRSRISSEAPIKPSGNILGQTAEDQGLVSPVLCHIAGDRAIVQKQESLEQPH